MPAEAAEPSLRRRRRLLVVLIVLSFGQIGQTQNITGNAITYPSEARALNRMFERWGILGNTSQWNINGEICSGVAIDATDVEATLFNPSIKCDCSYDNNSTCHITLLRVYALNVAGPLPDELWNFTYLTNLNLAQNYFTGPLPATIGNLRRLQYLIGLILGPLSSAQMKIKEKKSYLGEGVI